MKRIAFTGGILLISMGVTWLFPYIFEYLQGNSISSLGQNFIWVSPFFIAMGTISLWVSRNQKTQEKVPSTVRMTNTATILFLSFCSLEFSDGITRQDGRVFYWTSVLFLPFLVLLFGVITEKKWAWWIARGSSLLLALGFIVMIGAIPFGDLQKDGVPIGPLGRLWMVGVTSVFLSVTIAVFLALGRKDTIHYFENQKCKF